jgi:hypothetical protein
MNLRSSGTVDMAVLSAVVVLRIGHPHLQTPTPHARERSDGVQEEEEEEEVRKRRQGAWRYCSVMVPIL